MRKYVALILLSFALLRAGFIEILGGQKVGTTSMAFLKIGVGARAEGFGGAFVGLSDDPSALHYNPGGVGFMKVPGVSFSHVRWFADISYEFMGLIVPLGKRGTIGIQAKVLHMPYMKVTDEYHPYGTGDYFTFGDRLLGITYSKDMTDRFSFGFTLKAMEEQIADLRTRGFALDVGALYLVGYRDIRIGVALLNLGPDVRPSGDEGYSSFSIPILYRLGASGFIFEGFRGLFEIEKASDQVEVFKVGAGYRVGPVELRCGYKLNNRIEGGKLSGLSFGAGFRANRGTTGLVLDYAYGDMGLLGPVHRFSLNLSAGLLEGR